MYKMESNDLLGVIEFSILNCIKNCESPKATERKKGIKDLLENLKKEDYVKFLSEESSLKGVTWNTLFNVSHRALLAESDRIRSDEQKGSTSAASVTLRENAKLQCVTLVSHILKTATRRSPKIRCDDILTACLRILKDNYLRKSFGRHYISILLTDVLPDRKYWSLIKDEQWNDLLSIFVGLWKKEMAEEDWMKNWVIETLNLIVQHGFKQSHLGIRMKRILLPLLAQELCTVPAPSSQEAVLALAESVCSEMAKESRTAVCHIGETILPSVCEMYNFKGEVQKKKNDLIIEFLLLQVKCHHPRGARQGDAGAFACDWDLWNRQMRTIYRVVMNELTHSDKSRRLSTVFLELSVKLCHQLFVHGGSAYDITLNESAIGSAPKRRRLIVGFQAVVDELHSSTPWPWLQLLSAMLWHHPELIEKSELEQLIKHLWELQCTCKDPIVMGYICQCCECLLKIGDHLEVDTDIWLKIWDTMLSTVGLNQCEEKSHSLLRTLIIKGKVSWSGLDTLVRLFQSHNIQVSAHSLHSLLVLCNHHVLPESSAVSSSAHLPALWEQSQGMVRTSLLKWLLTTTDNFAIHANTPYMARLLVVLSVKTKACFQTQIEVQESSQKELESDLESHLLISAFEECLVTNGLKPCASSAESGEIKTSNIPFNLVDSVALRKLEELLQERARQLAVSFESSNCNVPSTQKTSTTEAQKTKMNNAYDAASFATLLAHILSDMVESGIVKEENLGEYCVIASLKNLLEMLGTLLPETLKPCEPGSSKSIVNDAEGVLRVLDQLSELYSCNLAYPVFAFLRENTPPGVILPVYTLFTSILPNNDSDPDDPDDTYSPHKTSVLISDQQSLSETDTIHANSLRVLIFYGCATHKHELIAKQKNVLNRLLKALVDSHDLARPATFSMVVRSVKIILKSWDLHQEMHLRPLLELFQALCRRWNQDAEASSHILILIRGFLDHISRVGGNYERDCIIRLLTPFKRKLFGPQFSVELILCFRKLIHVDSALQWARWKNGSDLSSLAEGEDFKPEALEEHKDANGCTAIVEELLFFINSPFHEVRLAAVNSITHLFTCVSYETVTSWHGTLFARLASVMQALFIIKGDCNNREERIDEGSNRTATVLHMLVSIVGSSSHCRKQALFYILQLMKLKDLSVDLVRKALSLLEKLMNMKNIQPFLLSHLPYLISRWLEYFPFKDFPCQLLGLTSWTEFLSQYKKSIVPILLKRQDQAALDMICQEIKQSFADILEDCFPVIMARLLPVFSFDGMAGTEFVVVAAKQQYSRVVEVLGKENISRLMATQLGNILIEVTRLVWDSGNLNDLLGISRQLPPPDEPFFSHSEFLLTLQYLQKTSDPDTELLIMVGCNQPSVIQNVLLQLRAGVSSSLTIQQRLLALYHYCIFAHALAIHLQQGALGSISEFIIRDVSHTLLHLVRDFMTDPALKDLSVASCRYLCVLYEHALPACVKAVSCFLHTIVGTLVPLAQDNGLLASDSLRLLHLLVVTHEEGLRTAISQLPPFPEDQVFDEVRRIHMEVKYGDASFSLKDEIVHFLCSVSDVSDYVSKVCTVEGLQFLRKQLAENKIELQQLYRDLEDMRGFSEDCAKSVLHQLVCTLVSLASSNDPKIRLEAAGCLGELGPADLTTLILRPAEGSVDISSGSADALILLMARAAHLLTGYLLDTDFQVVQAASTALYGIMSTTEAQSLLGAGHQKRTPGDREMLLLEREKILPFISLNKNSNKKSNLTKDNGPLLELLKEDKMWCPEAGVSHHEWVSSLVSSLFRCISEENSFCRQLIPVSSVKLSFAEEMLPVLLNFGLNFSNAVCEQMCGRISQFFRCHSDERLSQVTSRDVSKSNNIYLNKASVQCMLNAVNFIRLQRAKGISGVSVLNLNYLHIAQAAQFCCAYFSSVMYAELWCDDENRRNHHFSVDGGSSLAPVDYICEANMENGYVLQNLLREAYKQIGDPDAIHGCGSNLLVNPETRVEHYAEMGMWDQVLLTHDLNIKYNKNVSSTSGVAQALFRNGLLNVLTGYMNSLPADQTETLKGVQLECMWRLGIWTHAMATKSKGSEFEWYQLSALKGIHDGDKASVIQSVIDGRLSVLESLAHASLESCNSVYWALARLQALQEVEDTVNGNDNIMNVLDKWKKQDSLTAKDFHLIEPILAQRSVILENLLDKLKIRKSGGMIQSPKSVTRMLEELHLNTAKMARLEGWPQVAEQSLHSLEQMPQLSRQAKWQLRLEQAQLAWSRGRCAVDTSSYATARQQVIARQQLRLLVMELRTESFESEMELDIHSSALRLYGTWLAESRSENPQVIIERYLEQALNVYESCTSDSSHSQLETHRCLARFADLEYQRVALYVKSETFVNKQKCMDALSSEVKHLQKDKGTDEQRAARANLGHVRIDEKEISNAYQERDLFLLLAMKHYLHVLQHGKTENLLVFRFISLWLENTNHEDVNKLLDSQMSSIPSYKFIVLLPQLTARIGDNLKDCFTRTLNILLMRCAIDHPHHTLPLILALANSFKDQEYSTSKKTKTSEPRVIGATRMIAELRKQKDVGSILIEMEMVATALISFAYLPVPKEKDEAKKRANKSIPIPKGEKIKQLKNLESAMVPVITLPVRSDARYTDVVGIHSFESSYSTAGGINQPKKITCIGTDGVRRPTLVKGQDDLRQDAVMQQVFAIMNTLLQTNKETHQRKLLIRTYKIVPLTQRSGVLEWCQNTAPLGELLFEVHSKCYPKDWKPALCRKKLADAASKPSADKLRDYKEVCRNFHPAFRYFFTEKFLAPGVWFERRLAYIHSVATNSMVGYILGLGDRHVQNILVDQTTAELVHIDFGIAFEQGRILPTPETVPFRLSRDIEDGMGVSGIEGVFRSSCEKTMTVLRSNQETILTILEVLLYDPLYAWTLTPKSAASCQSKNSSRSSVSSESEADERKASNVEVNKMAERVLLRLQQKLQGTEEGPVASIEGQVNRLIQQARDPANLSKLYHGWQAYL